MNTVLYRSLQTVSQKMPKAKKRVAFSSTPFKGIINQKPIYNRIGGINNKIQI